MYYRISMAIMLSIALILFADIIQKAESKKVLIESLDYVRVSNNSSSAEPILYVDGKSIRIEHEAFYELYGKDSLNIEYTPIIKLPKRFYVKAEKKHYTYLFLVIIGLLSLNVLFFSLTFIIDGLELFLSVVNTISFFLFVWMAYF